MAVCQLSQQVPHGAQQDQPQLPTVLHPHIHGGGGQPGEPYCQENGEEVVFSLDYC